MSCDELGFPEHMPSREVTREMVRRGHKLLLGLTPIEVVCVVTAAEQLWAGRGVTLSTHYLNYANKLQARGL